MDHLDISNTADSTGVFSVVRIATIDVLSFSVFFFIWHVERSLRKLTKNIFDFSVLFWGVYLDVYYLRKLRLSFSKHEVKVCFLL
jgi:hypothetical protein